MITSTLRLAIFATSIGWCAAALAIDTPRTPSPVVSPTTAGQAVPPHIAPGTASDNHWRFKYHNNRWWYWLPEETWVYWSGDRWLTYDPATFVREQPQPQVSYASPARGSRAPYYGRSRSYNYNYQRPVAVPFYGYPGMSPYTGGGFRFGIIN